MAIDWVRTETTVIDMAIYVQQINGSWWATVKDSSISARAGFIAGPCDTQAEAEAILSHGVFAWLEHFRTAPVKNFERWAEAAKLSIEAMDRAQKQAQEQKNAEGLRGQE